MERVNKETKIIKGAVRKAIKSGGSRKDIAQLASRLSAKKGVNVTTAPYLQDIFIAALDEECECEE